MYDDNCKLTHWAYWLYYMQFPLENRENKNSRNVSLGQIHENISRKISTYTVYVNYPLDVLIIDWFIVFINQA